MSYVSHHITDPWRGRIRAHHGNPLTTELADKDHKRDIESAKQSGETISMMVNAPACEGRGAADVVVSRFHLSAEDGVRRQGVEEDGHVFGLRWGLPEHYAAEVIVADVECLVQARDSASS